EGYKKCEGHGPEAHLQRESLGHTVHHCVEPSFQFPRRLLRGIGRLLEDLIDLNGEVRRHGMGRKSGRRVPGRAVRYWPDESSNRGIQSRELAFGFRIWSFEKTAQRVGSCSRGCRPRRKRHLGGEGGERDDLLIEHPRQFLRANSSSVPPAFYHPLD